MVTSFAFFLIGGGLVIPLLEAFANYVISLLNGTRDLPFLRLTALSYWTYLFGGPFIYSRLILAWRRTAVGSRTCRSIGFHFSTGRHSSRAR